MKKCLCLVSILMFVLVGCGTNNTSNTNSKPVDTTTQVSLTENETTDVSADDAIMEDVSADDVSADDINTEETVSETTEEDEISEQEVVDTTDTEVVGSEKEAGWSRLKINQIGATEGWTGMVLEVIDTTYPGLSAGDLIELGSDEFDTCKDDWGTLLIDSNYYENGAAFNAILDKHTCGSNYYRIEKLLY